jgi:hypothetical protein
MRLAVALGITIVVCDVIMIAVLIYTASHGYIPMP